MILILALVPALSLTFARVAAGLETEATQEQAKAIAYITRAGGKVTIDEKSPDKAVISVDLTQTNVTDAGLANLRGLSQLQSLDLAGTKVSDAGLEQLKALTKLTRLWLQHTKVSDAGLVHLKGLSKLKTRHYCALKDDGFCAYLRAAGPSPDGCVGHEMLATPKW